MHDFIHALCVHNLLPHFDIKYGIRTDSGFRSVVDSCVEFIVCSLFISHLHKFEASGKTEMQLIFLVPTWWYSSVPGTWYYSSVPGAVPVVA